MNIEEQRIVAEPVEELEEVQLDDSRPDRITRIGTFVNQTVRQALALFLKENKDVFAWSHQDMLEIDPTVMVHRLNTSPSFPHVRQKKRVFAPERDRAIAEEVRKLQKADFIRKVYYPDWLANIVMVKKANGKWRMCVDFTDLNKACSKDREELFLYLVVSSAAVSATLIREEKKVQKLVYFISWALREAEERYPQIEKLAFALVTAARKLKPYFQAHTINVLTDKPLLKAMSNPEAAGRMALWAIELSEFDIQYRPRTAIKGQILADFVAEITTTKEQGAEETPIWRIHTDESSNKHVGGAGIVLHTPEGDKIQCMLGLDFTTTNNGVEYEALVAGLELAIAAGAKKAIVYSNSQIVACQVNRSYDCKNERMKRYLGELSSLLDDISMQEVSNENGWTAPIMAYLKEGKLPDNKEDARKLKVKAARGRVWPSSAGAVTANTSSVFSEWTD
ncbi:uncharacterized protein LOC142635522 [Castanea sativa]|uniref:uncharacterized protein LOC142635522 n=1 Tax=Castanea sativa TaxID=21020 RepID=UPI003F64DDA6